MRTLNFNPFKAVSVALLVMLILCIPSNAAPSFTTWDNSKDGTGYYPVVADSESITFNVTADEVITQYYWYKDDVLVSNDWDNYTTSWASPFTKNISVIATSASGNTSMLTWNPVVNRAVATTTPETINETPHTDMLTAVGNDDFEGFFGSVSDIFTNVMGTVFYLALFGIYFVMVWIRQEGVSMPMVLLFSLGTVLLGFVTESFVQGILALVVICATAVFYSLFKERR